MLNQHQLITLKLEEKHRPLNFKPAKESSLSVVCTKVKFSTLFPGINQNTKPIKMLSKKYSKDKRKFIEKEIWRLPENYIFEESISQL